MTRSLASRQYQETTSAARHSKNLALSVVAGCCHLAIVMARSQHHYDLFRKFHLL